MIPHNKEGGVGYVRKSQLGWGKTYFILSMVENISNGKKSSNDKTIEPDICQVQPLICHLKL